MRKHVSIIVAMNKQNGIGIENKLPWDIPEDLAFFKKMTLGSSIIMGRKTFESIGRALPGRQNIVVSRNHEWSHDGVERENNLLMAIGRAKNEDVFIIGGSQIYQKAMQYQIADQLIVTEVDCDTKCDAFFPKINSSIWKESSRESYVSEKHKIKYDFVVYDRINDDF